MSKKLLGLIASLFVCVTNPLAAQEATVSGSLISQTEWAVAVGLMFAADLEWELTDHILLGGHVAYFSSGSTSSDSVGYDRQVLRGYNGGPQVRYRFRPGKTIDPYISGRLLVMYGDRGYGYDSSKHLTLAPGLGVGVDFWLDSFRAGIFYDADFPLFAFDDFGGVFYTLLFPGVRLGFAF